MPSSGNVNFNFDKLPDSPLFWGVLVPIGIFIGLLATGHTATAFVFFLAIAAVGCIADHLAVIHQHQRLLIVHGATTACSRIAVDQGVVHPGGGGIFVIDCAGCARLVLLHGAVYKNQFGIFCIDSPAATRSRATAEGRPIEYRHPAGQRSNTASLAAGAIIPIHDG